MLSYLMAEALRKRKNAHLQFMLACTHIAGESLNCVQMSLLLICLKCKMDDSLAHRSTSSEYHPKWAGEKVTPEIMCCVGTMGMTVDF